MKKLLGIVFSNKTTLVALLGFGFAMAYATFVENDFGTPVARRSIYDAWWFELLMLILLLNFAGNITRYKLLRKEKIGILTFHVAFIITLIGAFITRYTGQEGLVRIREGESTNHILSEKRYFTLSVTNKEKHWDYQKLLSLTQFHQPDFSIEFGEETPIRIKSTRSVPDAVQGLVEGTDKDEVLEIVSASEGNRISYYLGSENSIFLSGHEVTFNNPKEDAINITGSKGDYLITSSESFDWLVMATQRVGRLPENSTDTLQLRALYRSSHLNFVVAQYYPGKKLDFAVAQDKEMAKSAADLLFVELTHEEDSQKVILASLDGVFSPLQKAYIGPYEIALSYGPRIIEMPFQLHLKDFQLERYPGSTSPSSYASELIVIDDEGQMPFRISMNNVLDHKGYRFFQASYDLDELGTVLSVNRDYWGTIVTYIGYFLMGLGMFFTLFSKNSRFSHISRKLAKLKAGKELSAAVLILTNLIAFSAVANDEREVNEKSVNALLYVDEIQASDFGELLVQDMDGRIKPINTLASEFLRKLTRRTSYEVKDSRNVSMYKLTPDQVFLSLHKRPDLWQSQPIIAVDEKKGAYLLEGIGLHGKKMLSFNDLIGVEGGYLLHEEVKKVQLKKPAERAEFEKEILKVDERFNILYQALSGGYLKIFPQPNDPDQKWYDRHFLSAGFSPEDSVFVQMILPVYFQYLEAAETDAADEKLLYIKTFQKEMGKNVYPDDSRVRAELLYNKLNIFNRLFPIYWMLGIYLIVLALAKVFSNSPFLKKAYLLGVVLTAIAFLMQTFNMILRWYAGGYPPWSNGYEMIILVAWALFLFGFIFYRKSEFVLPLVALFGGTLLFVSYLDWLNPEITNLVPVLKSYWLKIHVAIIVSSYAPLALSALLGLMVLLFMIGNESKFANAIKELTYINELSMTIGLFLLTIGTFLGGVWANESWGRYWGWDPKETWALISIIVYAVVLHLRLVPKLKGTYTFNIASVIAFFSIIMTSFGVNYYLSGLHSYAAGDPVPIPTFVYWLVGIIFIIVIAAYYRSSDKMKYSES